MPALFGLLPLKLKVSCKGIGRFLVAFYGMALTVKV